MKLQNIQALLSNSRNPTLTKLDPAYRKEKKTEKLISTFWADLSQAHLKSDSFFQTFDTGHFRRRYFNENEQYRHTLSMDGKGKFINKKGNLVNGTYLYIVGKNSELIAVPNQKNLHHSFAANGKKTKGAGFMVFEDGVLKVIDNNSGHYKPTVEQMMELLSAICQTVPNEVTFVDYSHVKDGMIYKCQVKDLIYIIEKGGTLEDVAEMAVKEAYSEQKRPNNKFIKTRFQSVKDTERNLRQSLAYRLESDGEADESGYTYDIADADDFNISEVGNASDTSLPPNIGGDSDDEENSMQVRMR